MLMSKSLYEEKILSEIHTLPEEALPKVLKLLLVIKDEFLTQDKTPERTSSAHEITHANTKRLMSTSRTNWAHDMMTEREERV